MFSICSCLILLVRNWYIQRADCIPFSPCSTSQHHSKELMTFICYKHVLLFSCLLWHHTPQFLSASFAILSSLLCELCLLCLTAKCWHTTELGPRPSFFLNNLSLVSPSPIALNIYMLMAAITMCLLNFPIWISKNHLKYTTFKR